MKLKQIPGDFVVEEIPLNFNFLDNGKYQVFMLEKKDYDTEKVILKLSGIFKIPRKFFNYAGSKDRKAVTKQYFSVKINNKKLKNIETENFKASVLGFLDHPISLGDLRGNKFVIVVRDLSNDELNFFFERLNKLNKMNNKMNSEMNSEMNNSMNNKNEINFINYFGEQRFSKKNYDIGFSLIKKDFKKAYELIDFAQSKKHLEKNKNDFIGAIKKVPFKILTMYINSVQSYLFNEVCSLYIKKKSKKYFEVDYNLNEKKIKKFVFTDEKTRDIEIPLVSFDTEFDNKELKDIYTNVLKREKIGLSDFVVRQLPDLTAKGSKRKLLAKASCFEIISNSNEDFNDELNKNRKKIKIAFTLDKGCYATVFLKYLFLNSQAIH